MPSKTFIGLFSGIALCLCWNCSSDKDLIFSEKEFVDPPVIHQVHTWWHWMDGAISREGITRDLESMKQQGVSQATILNVGLFNDKDFGVQKVPFNSPEWHQMFRWALEEAQRLGISIGVHNCDGWSSSGGPWITPEKAMKQATWTKTIVAGTSSDTLAMATPFSIGGYYRDVAVVAVRTRHIPNRFSLASPKVILDGQSVDNALTDASPASYAEVKQGSELHINTDQPIEVSALVIRPRKPFQWEDMDNILSEVELSCYTKDGKRTTLGTYTLKGVNRNISVSFPKVVTTHFVIHIKNITDSNPWMAYSISEVSLLADGEQPVYLPTVPFHEEKMAAVKANQPGALDSVGSTPVSLSSDIIDITKHLLADNRLVWKKPAGNWAIYRFGYTITGARNSPATPGGVGLECDKMDTSALNQHFNSFSKKLINTAGAHTGKTFKFLLIDSWECAFQNWTATMPAEFANRRGYDLVPWIPVLCGDAVADEKQSEAFLYDYRSTIAELIETNYYKQFQHLCHANHLEFHAEVIYGGGSYPPLDVLRTNSYCDMPMFEFWAGSNAQAFPEYTPVVRPLTEMPVSASLFYNKPVMGAEAYTGYAHYSESPMSLKPFGDRAYCQGINQFVLHSYVHQPTEERPGMTLGNWASHFNRNNTVWNYSKDWLTSHARIQSVLQKGTAVYDVLFYLGDQLPQDITRLGMDGLPYGYSGALCNFDILQNKLEVERVN